MSLQSYELKKILFNKSILEIGCNIGIITKQLLLYNPQSIDAIDTNIVHLSKKKLSSKKVSFKRMNIFHDKIITKKYDVIFIRHFFCISNISFKEKKKLIENLTKNYLNYRGKIIIIDFYIISFYIQLIKKILNVFNLNNNQFRTFLKSRYCYLKNSKDKYKYFSRYNWQIKIFNKDFLRKKKKFNFTYTLIAQKK